MVDRKMKILIVDDERSNLEILSRILKPGNTQNTDTYIETTDTSYTLCVAKSGQAALRKAAEEKPDLILLDIIMPDMSGFEVLSALKESDETRNIPVIFITGLDSFQDEEKGFSLGAVDYITKPFHNSLVRARVKTHLRIVEQMRMIEGFGLTDSLTNLPNRRSFDKQIALEWERAIRDKTPISMLMIDIDCFKKYNDTYGHMQGDRLIKVLAGVFAQSLYRPADFAARWGGEEFAVILPNTDIDGAACAAERIRGNVEHTEILSAEGLVTTATISIGVTSEKPCKDKKLEELINKADEALYDAKNSGRNRVCRYEMKG